MRAVRLPASMAVCAEANSHFVITALDSCRGFQQFKQKITEQQADRPKDASAHVAPPQRFRVDCLQPAEWASVLSHSRAITHPNKAYTFSSPGDVSAPTAAAAGGGAVENGAYMHIVERSAGDFTPNNMIYHHLQRYTINEGSGDGVVKGFRELVKATQAGEPQRPEEAAVELLGRSAVLSAEAKAALDPLHKDEEALAKTNTNKEVVVSAGGGQAASGSPVFTFYPFPCPVAASIPYCSRHFCVLVNLKPIVPNHLMVVPLRCVGTIHALTREEVEDWGRTVALTIRVLNKVKRRKAGVGAAATNTAKESNYSVAIQQGELAGQTVPHLHTHIIPFDLRGKLVGEPEADEEEQRNRPPRTVDTMKEETEYFKSIFVELARKL